MVEFDRLAPVVQTNSEVVQFWNDASKFVNPVIQFAYDNSWVTKQTILAPMFQPEGDPLHRASTVNIGIAVPHPETKLPMFFAGVAIERVPIAIRPIVVMKQALALATGQTCTLFVRSSICSDNLKLPDQPVYAKSLTSVRLTGPLGSECVLAEWARDMHGGIHLRKPFVTKSKPPQAKGVGAYASRTSLVANLSREIDLALSGEEPTLEFANWDPLKSAMTGYQPDACYRLIAHCMTRGTFDNSARLTVDELLESIGNTLQSANHSELFK